MCLLSSPSIYPIDGGMGKEYVVYIYIYTHTHIHNGISLGHVKETNNAICSNMDGPRDCHTDERNQIEKDKYHIIIAYLWNLKNATNELIYKTDVENKIMVTRGESAVLGGINWETGLTYTHYYIICKINN